MGIDKVQPFLKLLLSSVEQHLDEYPLSCFCLNCLDKTTRFLSSLVYSFLLLSSLERRLLLLSLLFSSLLFPGYPVLSSLFSSLVISACSKRSLSSFVSCLSIHLFCALLPRNAVSTSLMSFLSFSCFLLAYICSVMCA